MCLLYPEIKVVGAVYIQVPEAGWSHLLEINHFKKIIIVPQTVKEWCKGREG